VEYKIKISQNNSNNNKVFQRNKKILKKIDLIYSKIIWLELIN